MLDDISVIQWLIENVGAWVVTTIAAIPAILAAWWARKTKLETQPNGGKSLRDQIDRIARRQVILMERMHQTEQKQEKHASATQQQSEEFHGLREELKEHYDVADRDREMMMRIAQWVRLPNIHED